MSTGNRSTDDTSFVSYLECSESKQRFNHDRMHGLSSAGHPLLVRYDLDAVRAAVCKKDLERRRPDMWRYRELLPMPGMDWIVELGEAMTPLIRLPRLSNRLGVAEILVKDEGRLPTGSFKARGMAVAVTMAKVFGKTRIAVPTAGNAGSAAVFLKNRGMTLPEFYQQISRRLRFQFWTGVREVE